MSSDEKSDVMKLSASFPIVDLEEYDIAKKTTQFNHVNHVIEKPNTKNAKRGKNLK